MSYGQQPYGQPQNPYGQQPAYQASPYAPPAQPGGFPPFQPQGAPQQFQPQPQGWQPQPQPGPPPIQPPAAQQPPPAHQPPPVPRPPALQTPVPPPPSRKAQARGHGVPVTTSAGIPRREVAAIIADVHGVAIRVRASGPDAVFALVDARQDAVDALVEMAVAAGAEAVVGLRFDSVALDAGTTEVAAYATAVKLAPLGPTTPPSPAAGEETSAEPSAV